MNNILFLSSEVTPFAKTGGLADVCSALPKALSKFGKTVKIVMPRYYRIDKSHLIKTPISLCVDMGSAGEIWAGVYKTCLPNTKVEIYFIEHEGFYGRDGLYDENSVAYLDNDIRFIFLSKASLILSKAIDFKPDIIHTNDWHTASANILLKTAYINDSFFKNTKSILTIHNLQHQGEFDASVINLLAIDKSYFTFDKLEKYGRLNLLKGGITFADAVTTVSPKYAQEIQTPEFGFGLEEHIKANSYKLYGILNGVDYDEWNPETDIHIIKNYNADSLNNKLICKNDLQNIFNLPVSNDPPVLSFIGRFAEQKGIHLIASIIDQLMQMNLQFIILGSGQQWAENFFKEVSNKYENFAAYIGYNEALAHKIEAGSDLFVMPSNFEPCGLNQIYSLKYGTLPIVRAVGGLDDTIVNFNPETSEGTGFKFYDATPEALLNTIKWAIDTYNQKDIFKKLQLRAMEQNFDWKVSAEQYLKIYQNLLGDK
jgi:starch synthase